MKISIASRLDAYASRIDVMWLPYTPLFLWPWSIITGLYSIVNQFVFSLSMDYSTLKQLQSIQ